MKYRNPIIFGLTVFVCGVIVANFFHLYTLVPHIDKVFHFMGGVALGWFFYVLFYQNFLYSKFIQILNIVSATCFVAVLWEYAERLSTLYAPQYLPWLAHWIQGGDLNDTLLDVFAGMAGALFFIIHRLFFKK